MACLLTTWILEHWCCQGALVFFFVLLVVGGLGTAAPRADTALQTDVVGTDELLVHLLNRLEVVDSLDVQFQSGILVANNHSARVKLNSGNSPHVVDALLNALGQGQSLVSTSDDDANLASIHDSAKMALRDGVR